MLTLVRCGDTDLVSETGRERGGLYSTHIRWRSAASLTNDLFGTNIGFGVFTLSSAPPHIRSGKFTALGRPSSNIRREPPIFVRWLKLRTPRTSTTGPGLC